MNHSGLRSFHLFALMNDAKADECFTQLHQWVNECFKKTLLANEHLNVAKLSIQRWSAIDDGVNTVLVSIDCHNNTTTGPT